MIWTILIVLIHQALCIDKTLTLTVEQFVLDRFIILETYVDALLFSVQGKRDKKSAYLVVWADHYCPDFNAVKGNLL